jgi:hypothetical protein
MPEGLDEFEKHAAEEGLLQMREKEKMELAMRVREKLEKYRMTPVQPCVYK